MLVNKTKKTIISKELFKKGALGKIKGLIGEKKARGIILSTRFGIHTFFLQFSIDVIILDKDNRVVALKSDLKPNRIFAWNIKFDKVIELPNGCLKKSKTEAGDILELTFS